MVSMSYKLFKVKEFPTLALDPDHPVFPGILQYILQKRGFGMKHRGKCCGCVKLVTRHAKLKVRASLKDSPGFPSS